MGTGWQCVCVVGVKVCVGFLKHTGSTVFEGNNQGVYDDRTSCDCDSKDNVLFSMLCVVWKLALT